MLFLNTGLSNYSNIDLLFIVETLKKGGVVILPTDTVYGLSCLATDNKAIDRIKELKKRDYDKPLLVLVSSLRMIKKYCFLNQKQVTLFKKFQAQVRPTSFILPYRHNLAPNLVNDFDGLAVRLPKSKFLLKIVRSLKLPLVSTSLNLSGEKVCQSLENINQIFQTDNPDLVVESGALRGESSRIIDLRNKEVLIIRK